jgi:hypothetical protein
MTVKWYGASIFANVAGAAMRGVVRGTESVRAEGTNLILKGTKSGKVYRRRGVEHKASAPGEAPASDTGALVQSAQTSYDVPEIAGTASWGTKHAEPLEFGSETMEARPYARPELANRKDAIEKDIAEEIRVSLSP